MMRKVLKYTGTSSMWNSKWPAIQLGGLADSWVIEWQLFKLCSLYNDEFEAMWKVVVMAYFKVIFQQCLKELRKTMKNLGQDN
jgi:hypothetical protein